MKIIKKCIAFSLLAIVMVMVSSTTAYAMSNTSGSESYNLLGSLIVSGKESPTSVTQVVSTTKTYTASGGGYVAYSSLVSTSYPQTGFVVEGNFELLTSASKRDFLSDLFELTDCAKRANSNITSDTLTTWNQCIQTCRGVDAQLIAVLMQDTKPDFISAMKIYAPFQSPISTALGVFALLLFSGLTVSTLIDLFFIGIPPFNMFLMGDGKEKPGIVSSAAYNAYLTEASGAGGGQGGKTAFKSAAGVYFKHRVVMLMLMFVCILYLVSGEIWNLLADLMSLFGGAS